MHAVIADASTERRDALRAELERQGHEVSAVATASELLTAAPSSELVVRL